MSSLCYITKQICLERKTLSKLEHNEIFKKLQPSIWSNNARVLKMMICIELLSPNTFKYNLAQTNIHPLN